MDEILSDRKTKVMLHTELLFLKIQDASSSSWKN